MLDKNMTVGQEDSRGSSKVAEVPDRKKRRYTTWRGGKLQSCWTGRGQDIQQRSHREGGRGVGQERLK